MLLTYSISASVDIHTKDNSEEIYCATDIYFFKKDIQVYLYFNRTVKIRQPREAWT